MKLKITITKTKGQLWGHLLVLNDVLIENGATVAEIQNKLQNAVQHYYEFDVKSLHFYTESTSIQKARCMANRLKRKTEEKPLQIQFNSKFFD